MSKSKQIVDAFKEVPSTTLEALLGPNDEAEKEVKIIEGLTKSPFTANYRCYDCQGKGKLYNSHGKHTESHKYNTSSVRYDFCNTCHGKGTVDFITFKAKGFGHESVK